MKDFEVGDDDDCGFETEDDDFDVDDDDFDTEEDDFDVNEDDTLCEDEACVFVGDDTEEWEVFEVEDDFDDILRTAV